MAHDVRNPHIFVDGPGNTASGDQVMDNFDALWVARDVLAAPGRIVGGGVSSIDASGSRTNVAYGALSNGPDQVTGLVLPTDGQLEIWVRALFQSSVAAAGKAALFIGANQLKIEASNATAPAVQEVQTGSLVNTDGLLHTYGQGLGSNNNTGGNQTLVTTGQVIGGSAGGGPVIVEAAAGTYTVSLQFLATSGSVTAQKRRLWVAVRQFT
jgi:hypothetical protein